MQNVITLFFHILVVAFLIGMAGCLFVIPVTAFRLFSVLFERDEPGGDGDFAAPSR